MNDNIDLNDNDDTLAQDELLTLKARATQMGIKFRPEIGLDKLKIKVNLALQSPEVTNEQIPKNSSELVSNETIHDDVMTNDNVTRKNMPSVVPTVGIETFNEKRNRLKRESFKLIRIRATCMNPNKNDHDGEVFTVGNSIIGSVKRFVPFNADEGWHVEYIIYQAMKERQCQVFYTFKAADGSKVRRGKLIKEFAIEVMDALTTNELGDLAKTQAISRSLEA